MSRKSQTDEIDPEDVLALLEDGPKETGALVQWLRHPTPRVIAACRTLAHAGRIKRLPQPDMRWALPSFHLSAELLERIERMPARTAGPKRVLREPKAKAPVIPKDGAPAWWVNRPAAGFTDAARDHVKPEKQQTSKPGWQYFGS